MICGKITDLKFCLFVVVFFSHEEELTFVIDCVALAKQEDNRFCSVRLSVCVCGCVKFGAKNDHYQSEEFVCVS